MGTRTVSVLSLLALSLNATVAMAADAPAIAGPFGDRDMDAQVDLSQAYLPEAVYVTSVAANVTDESVAGSFTVENTEDVLVTGLQYRLELRGTGKIDGLPYAIDVVRASVALAPNESKKLLFATALPNVPAGRYDLRVQLLTAKGRALGWQDTPVVVSAERAATDFVTVVPGTIGIAAYGDELLPPLSGPNVDPSGAMTLRATAINGTDHAVRVTPVIDLYDFNAARVGLGSLEYSDLNVAAGETVKLDLPVTAEAAPGTYMAHLTLKDADSGETLSSIAQYRYVVKGEDADIVSVRIENMGTASGDWAYGTVDMAGAADALTTTVATLRVQLTDDKGTVGSIEVPGITLTDSILSAKIRIPLSRDLVGAPTVEASLLGGSETTYDHVRYAGTLTPAQLAGLTQNNAFSNWVAWHGLARIALFACIAMAAGYALFVLASRMRGSIAFARAATAAFLLVVFVGNVGSAYAAGGGGIETLTPVNGSAVFTPLGNRPIIALFVNSPVHGQANNFCNRQIQLSYRLEYGVCENEIAYTRVLGRVTRNGGLLSAYDVPGAVWDTVHNRTYQSQFCNTNYCFQVENFSGTIDLTNIVDQNANTATLQLLAKWGKNISMPDASFDRTDPYINLGWAHALNVHLQCTPPQLSVTKTVQSGSATPGSIVTYTFAVTNGGQTNAPNVTLNDVFLNGNNRYMPLEFVSAGGASCSFDSGAVQTSCSLGAISAGQTKTFTATFRVPQNQPQLCGQTIRNRAEARTNNQSAGSASAEAQVNIVCPPSYGCVEVFKEGFTSDNQRITGPLPSFTFKLDNQITATSDQNGFARFENVQPGTHSVSEVALGGWTNFLVTPQNGFVTVQAGSNCAGVTFKNRQDAQDADLSVVKTGAATVSLGTTVTYSLAVKNNGSTNAPNTILRDELPAGTTFNAAQSDTRCSMQGNSVACNLGTLAAGQTVTVSLAINVPANYASSTLVNRAAVLSDLQDPNLANNQSTFTSHVTASVGCIDIFKEGFDAGGSRLGTIPPFKFILDGNAATFVYTNNAGSARFSNVSAGQHTVSEVTASGWTLFNTTPTGGVVQVQPGSTCTGVVFKNRQQSLNADVSIVKSGPATAVRGGNLTYSITVTNNGPAAAQNVTVDDQLPAGLGTPVVSGAGCTVQNGLVHCVIGSMNVNDQRIITINAPVPAQQPCQPGAITNTGTVTSPNDSQAGNNSSSVTTQLQCPTPQQADLQVQKSGPTSVVRGQNAQYSIVVKNNGPAASPNTIVGDPLPAGTTFVAGQSDSRCVLQGNTVFCNLGTMQPGQQISLAITLNVTSQAQCQTGTVLNRASVLGDLQDPLLDNNQSTVTTQVTCSSPTAADVSVAKTGPSTAVRGTNVSYGITVSNLGPATASGVVLTDAVPTGLTLVASGTGCTLTNGVVSCQIGTLPASSTRAYTFVFSTGSATPTCSTGTATNTANVTSTSTDPNNGNNQSAVTTQITCPLTTGKDVHIVKTGPSIVTRGDNITYTLTTTNNGPGTATGVVLTDAIPAGLTYVSASAECTQANGVVTCQAGTLIAGQTRQFTITLLTPSVSPCSQISITNTATVTSSGTDNNTANNSSSLTTQVNCPNAQLGCIDVIKETYDTNGNVLTPVTQFTFNLDGTRTTVNDGLGRARFDNVPVGQHTVTENLPSGWTQLLVTPAGGTVNVTAGTCVAIAFKNRQTTQSIVDNFSITKTDHETDVDPGDTLEYEIRVRNLSSVRVTNVTVTDTLPDEVEFRDASPSESYENGRVIRWENQTFEANEEKLYRVEVDVDDNADGTLYNTADVRGRTATDRTDVNDNNRRRRNSNSRADIDLTKTASTSEVFPGGIIDYTVRVRNTGDDTIENLTLVDQLPPDVIVLDDGDADSRSGRRLEWEIDELDEGDEETFRYRVSVPTYMVAGQIVRNNVCTESDDDDIDGECESVSVSILGMIPKTGAKTERSETHLTPVTTRETPSDGTLPFLALIALAGAATGAGLGFGRKALFGL